jgi:hypothetical protein
MYIIEIQDTHDMDRYAIKSDTDNHLLFAIDLARTMLNSSVLMLRRIRSKDIFRPDTYCPTSTTTALV